MIRDKGIMESHAFEHVVKEELGDSVHVHSFGARSQYYPLCKAMVDHDHQGIMSVEKGKIGDKIDRKLFERKQRGRLNG